jgi:cold shock CspA family protein
MSNDSHSPRSPHAVKAKTAAKGLRKGERLEARGRATTGRITRIARGHGHGFIRAADDREVFFHRSDLPDNTFNDLTVDDRVAFEVLEDTVTGPRATKVRKIRRR